MIDIYYVPTHGNGTREYRLIGQGLRNNPRVKLVSDAKSADFIFQFYYLPKHRKYYRQDLPAKKTVLIDYHDRHNFFCPVGCFAYFKRSWVEWVQEENYVSKRPIPRPSHYHPLTMAIMDEFILDEKIERDFVLSCTLRRSQRKRHFNRIRVLDFLKKMDIKGKAYIGEFNKGEMTRFNEPDMKDYFHLLKRSRIVVTCNPNPWEGDHRTWEAFAAGALVFIDRMYTPMVHPLIDLKHCIFYDLSDQGLMELWKQIQFFTEDRNHSHAAEIAQAGHEFTMKYHRSSNRIDEILEVIL